ncbi:FAD-dependent monooxygenase [Nonomuraea sp. NPDC050536]|uniref:FAD-dependent monooxygenase n=1 Tax=Nonomuraea sp. NPDC050536 TaxID=3364366 RepID=UPI0037C57400
MRETEVVIVGAGPTGLMLACELALAGVETLVVESLPERIQQTKGGAIQPRTAELLELRGLLEPIQRRTLTREPVGGHFALLPVPLDYTSWDTRHPHPIAIPQWEVEEVLEERATSLGAEVVRDAPVTAVEQGDGVVVTAGDQRISARCLVACDGGHSTVRKLLDVPFPGRSGTYTAILADIQVSSVSDLVPTKIGHISDLVREVDGHWVMLVPLGGDRYRFTGGEPSQVSRQTPVAFEEIAGALRLVYGEKTVLAAIENASRFSDATRQVESYRVGEVFFAGDAAHIHPPLGGQGLNLGVQDAFNLGWKLAATLRGRAPAGLLDTYHDERHPVGAQVLHHTAAQRVFANPRVDEDVRALRDIFMDLMRLPEANRQLAGLMSGLAMSYDLPGDHPLVGHRVPDVDLGSIRLSSLFRSGNAVLLDFAGVLPPGIEATRAEPVPGLPAALLIRPDGYISWATDTTPDLEALAAAAAPHAIDIAGAPST